MATAFRCPVSNHIWCLVVDRVVPPAPMDRGGLRSRQHGSCSTGPPAPSQTRPGAGSFTSCMARVLLAPLAKVLTSSAPTLRKLAALPPASASPEPRARPPARFSAGGDAVRKSPEHPIGRLAGRRRRFNSRGAGMISALQEAKDQSSEVSQTFSNRRISARLSSVQSMPGRGGMAMMACNYARLHSG